MKSEKTRYAYLLMRAARGAGSIVKDANKLNSIVDTASSGIDSGMSQLNSVKSDFKTLLSMLRATARREYSGLSRTSLLLSAGAVIYFINPMDAIPDILPATGLLDDATVIGIVVTSLKKDIEKFREWQSVGAAISQDVRPEPLAS